MDKNKVKEFVKTHKKEIALTAVAVVGGVIIFAITKKKPKIVTQLAEAVPANKWRWIDAPELELGTITDLSTNGEWIDAIVNDITVGDLGRFGEELCKIEGVNPNTIVSSMMSFIGEKVEA